MPGSSPSMTSVFACTPSIFSNSRTQLRGLAAYFARVLLQAPTLQSRAQGMPGARCARFAHRIAGPLSLSSFMARLPHRSNSTVIPSPRCPNISSRPLSIRERAYRPEQTRPFRTFHSGWRAECSARSTVPNFSGCQRTARCPSVRLPCRRRPSCRCRRRRFPYRPDHH
jgi:hypothetical protein